jgi:hypothetical protein
MTVQTHDFPRLQPPAGLGWRLLAARGTVALEALWPGLRLWLAGWLLFLTLGMLGLWLNWPLLRVAVLAGLTLGSISWLGWQLARRPWPSQQIARTRLERDSGADPGVLALLADQPVQRTDPVSAGLWAEALRRARRRLPPLQLHAPTLPVVAADRFGVAPLLVLLFALGVMVAGRDSVDRLAMTLDPWPSAGRGIAITAWLTPPEHSGQAPRPVTITSDAVTQIDAPADSLLTLIVPGARKPLRWHGGDSPLESAAPGPDGATLAVRLTDAGDYRLASGWRTLAKVAVRITPDAPPRIRFTRALAITGTQSLDIDYQAEDDFSITRVALAVGIGTRQEAELLPEPPPGARAAGRVFRDLTASRFAGETVELRLVAFDGRGQRGVSAPVRMRLPERVFRDPIAQQVIAVRKGLFRQPFERERPVLMLGRLAEDWANQGRDLTVFLGLRSAAHRLAGLRYSQPGDVAAAGLLWEIALDIERQREGGDLEDLRRRFEEIAGRLGSKDEAGLKDALSRLEQALAKHLAGLLQKAAESGALNAQNAAAAAAALDPGTLEQLMQAIRERLAAGDQAGAQAALEQLQSIMENLSAAPSQSAAAQALQQAIQGLQGMAAEQQALQGQTGRSGKGQTPGAGGGAGNGLPGLAGAQADLARRLSEAMAGVPDGAMPGLAQAQAAMQEAAQALARGDQTGAMAAQSRALQQLNQALSQLSQQLAQMPGDSGALPQGLDPLGRMGGSGAVRDIEIPAEAERRMVQELRRLLEEKAADPNRSAEERAYYLRLLRRFEP